MKSLFPPFLFVLLLLLLSCRNQEDPNAGNEVAATSILYFNGDIVTMEGAEPVYAEAVVVNSGLIAFAGSKKEALKVFPGARQLDLEGRTLIPGLIEPHLHPSIAAVMLQNEIIAPYDWQLPLTTKKGVQGQEAYRSRIAASIRDNASPDKIYFIWGYHQLWHGELSRTLLNEIAGDQPVGIIHRSFHEIYLNDQAIKFLGIKESEFEGNNQVDWQKGHFYEGGWLALVPKMAPILLEPESYLKGLRTMSTLLLQNGITTIAEPGFPSSDFDGELNLLLKEMENNPPYDVYLIPNGTQLNILKGGNEAAMSFMESLSDNATFNSENVHFLPKQVKLFSDGAIYSQLMQMKDGYLDGHEGEWMTPIDLFESQFSMYWNNGYKIHIHSNGDLGQQMVIDLQEKMLERNPRKDHRSTLHHMGYFTPDMVEQMDQLGMEASVNPYYLWALADKYSEFGLGPQRAENLVALKLLTDKEIPVSFHSDFSMAPAEPLTLAWTAVNRQTSQGSRFSQEQRISVYEAMKTVTINAARTLNLEDQLGSIKEGKIANFTILEENPFKIDPIRIKDISVKGVVFKGNYFESPKNENMLVGGWQETEINETVESAVVFVLQAMQKPDQKFEIRKVKTQIVNGVNYDIDFELGEGELWNTKVHRSLDGDFSLMQEAKKVVN